MEVSFFCRQGKFQSNFLFKRRNGHHLWQVLRYVRRIFQKIEVTHAINLDAAHLYEQDPDLYLTKVTECVNQSKEQLYSSDSFVSDDPHAIV